MEENKELKDEEIVEETNKVEDNTEATENEEVEEIMEEYSETDDLSMIRKLKDENKKLSNELEALKDRLLRLTAEYDNYRKRTAKEKEGIYTDACTDVLKEVLPVADNLERALAVDGNVEDIKKGVEMTIKGFLNALEKLGVEMPIQSKAVREKAKQTCLEKYGVSAYSQSEEMKEKSKQTCLEKYGVEYPSQSDEIQNTRIEN